MSYRFPTGLTAHASTHLAGGSDPIRGLARSQLEYPTTNIDFAYLYIIGKAKWDTNEYLETVDVFADKGVEFYIISIPPIPSWIQHNRYTSTSNAYYTVLDTAASTADYRIDKIVNGVVTKGVGTEAVDLSSGAREKVKFESVGSTLKAYRADMTTPKITVTDTSFSSGLFGGALFEKNYIYSIPQFLILRTPASPLPPSLAIAEFDIEGSGKFEDPFRPSFSKSLAEITSLTGLPDFLYESAKKYDVLVKKGFTEDEIKVLLGYIPQHQVDLDSVTFGSFEFHPDKASTVIVTITGDNPYQLGAIDRQKAKAKRVFTPPKTYDEAISLYNTLVKDYPHWLAGKDNFAYQTLGLEVFDYLQNVDFYYGELIEHKTHYNQLKQVQDWEMRNRLNELMNRLNKVTVLISERDKHINKLKEIMSKGW